MVAKKTEDNQDLTEGEFRFVDEFLVDRDPYAAALRAGVARINLKRQVQKWMGDSRIMQAIKMRTDEFDIDKMISPQRIMAGFIEVAFDRTANHSARNTALRELAAIKKMYGDDDKNRKTSGVLFVPAMPALADWDEAAQALQAKLKDEVKN